MSRDTTQIFKNVNFTFIERKLHPELVFVLQMFTNLQEQNSFEKLETGNY